MIFRKKKYLSFEKSINENKKLEIDFFVQIYFEYTRIHSFFKNIHSDHSEYNLYICIKFNHLRKHLIDIIFEKCKNSIFFKD